MTLAGLATQAGLSKGYLSRVEHGDRQASPEATRAIANALGVIPEVLTGQFPPYRELRHTLSDGPRFDELAALLEVDLDELERIEIGMVVPTDIQVERMARRFGVPAEVLRAQH